MQFVEGRFSDPFFMLVFAVISRHNIKQRVTNQVQND